MATAPLAQTRTATRTTLTSTARSRRHAAVELAPRHRVRRATAARHAAASAVHQIPPAVLITSAAYSHVKRALDLVLTLVGLLVISPLLLAIAVLIKLDTPGPVIYRQVRVGRSGKSFEMWKFRSMRTDADALLAELQAKNEASGPLFKMRDDPRVTRVGRALRRLSLDELPQLLNVIRGEMSLVGPRPPLPREVAQYEPWQMGRLQAVPGLTGLWQVSGRSDLTFEQMVKLDLRYIQHWSVALDLRILFKTLPAVLTHTGAY